MTVFHEYASDAPHSVRYFTCKIWTSGIRCGVSEVSGNYSGPSVHNVLHYQLHATLSFRVYCVKFETNAHFECLFRVYIISSLRGGPNFQRESIFCSKIVTLWMFPPQNRSPRTVRSRIYGPPGPNIAAILGAPPAADGPTPVMAFRASVEAEKWARKDEADYAVSLSHRLGFLGELNNGTSLCMLGSKP